MEEKINIFLDGLAVPILIIAVVTAYFLLKMIMHAVKNNIQNRFGWIVVMLVTGLPGAVLYYFFVKRKMDKVTN